MDDHEARERVARVETLLEQLEALADGSRATRHRARAGAARPLRGGPRADGREVAARDDGELAAALAGDELVSHLLLLHGLHPVPVEARVRGALDEVRPYLDSHGGDVELLGVEDGVVRLRLEGSCNGCPSSTATLKLAIEDAIHKAAPDVERDRGRGGEGTGRGPGAAPARGRPTACARPTPAWAEAGGMADLADAPAVRDVAGEPVLFVRLGRAAYAYRPACPGCEAPLADAVARRRAARLRRLRAPLRRAPRRALPRRRRPAPRAGAAARRRRRLGSRSRSAPRPDAWPADSLVPAAPPRPALGERARSGPGALRPVRRADRPRAPAPARPRRPRADVRVPGVHACSSTAGRRAGATTGSCPTGACALDDFELDDLTWEELRLPVDMAFFFHSSREGRVMAFYPGPMGPTESLLELAAWAGARGGQPGPGDARAGRRGAARQPRPRGAAALDRADRRVLRARRPDPHALARADRRQGGLGGDRAVLRGARPALATREPERLKGAQMGIRTGKPDAPTDLPTHARGSSRATRRATTRSRPATCRTGARPPSARPASTPRATSRSTRACRTSRRPSRWRPAVPR